MILACQKLLGQITKVLGLRRTPPPVWEKLPKNPVFFSERLPKEVEHEYIDFLFEFRLQRIKAPIVCYQIFEQIKAVDRHLHEHCVFHCISQPLGSILFDQWVGISGNHAHLNGNSRSRATPPYSNLSKEVQPHMVHVHPTTQPPIPLNTIANRYTLLPYQPTCYHVTMMPSDSRTSSSTACFALYKIYDADVNLWWTIWKLELKVSVPAAGVT